MGITLNGKKKSTALSACSRYPTFLCLQLQPFTLYSFTGSLSRKLLPRSSGHDNSLVTLMSDAISFTPDDVPVSVIAAGSPEEESSLALS